MERRRLTALIVVAALLLIGAWPLLQRDPDALTTEPPVHEAPVPKGTDASPASPVGDATGEKREAAIPRPSRAKRSAPVVPASEDAPTIDTGIEKGGVNRSLELNKDTLHAVADRMRPSIAACVDAWTAQVPQIAGRVVLGFDLGPDGVQSAWIEEHEDVPTAVLGCFSSAVYEQDWPPAPDGVKVTFPFVVNAGLEPDEPGGGPVDKR